MRRWSCSLRSRRAALHPSFLRLIFRHSCASSSVIPAQAGTHCAHRHLPSTYPLPDSSLPPFRGEVRWGVGGCERALLGVLASIARLRLLSSFVRRQEPAHHLPPPQFIPPPF